MKGKFALTLTNHRILGPVFNAVIISPSANREYYTVTDRLSLANLRQYEQFLSPEEIRLVKIIEEYCDTQLLKVFSKKKISAQDFLASIDETLYETPASTLYRKTTASVYRASFWNRNPRLPKKATQ